MTLLQGTSEQWRPGTATDALNAATARYLTDVDGTKTDYCSPLMNLVGETTLPHSGDSRKSKIYRIKENGPSKTEYSDMSRFPARSARLRYSSMSILTHCSGLMTIYVALGS